MRLAVGDTATVSKNACRTLIKVYDDPIKKPTPKACLGPVSRCRAGDREGQPTFWVTMD